MTEESGTTTMMAEISEIQVSPYYTYFIICRIECVVMGQIVFEQATETMVTSQ